MLEAIFLHSTGTMVQEQSLFSTWWKKTIKHSATIYPPGEAKFLNLKATLEIKHFETFKHQYKACTRFKGFIEMFIVQMELVAS